MKSLIVMLLLTAAAGAVQAQPYHYAPSLFESRTSSSSDDTVRCMAIGCAEGDYERYPEYTPEPLEDGSPYMGGYAGGEVVEEDVPFDPAAEILKRLKDESPAGRVEPVPVPSSEDEARESFYRTLHRHADGAATIEEVEAAYGHLLPYRR